jgi:hypothetical protein
MGDGRGYGQTAVLSSPQDEQDAFLPPIKMPFQPATSTERSGFQSSGDHVREQLGSSYASQTSSSAARERASERRVTRRKLPSAVRLDDAQTVTPQRRRTMWRHRSDGGRMAAKSRRKLQVARSASEPVLRQHTPQDEAQEADPPSPTPELVRRQDHGRKMVGAMRDALEEVSKLDKELSQERSYLQRERAHARHPRRALSEVRRQPSWNDDTNVAHIEAAEEPSAAEEKQRRARHHDAVSRLALSAELQTTSGRERGTAGARIPRTSVPMELLFSANQQTSQATLGKALLNKGKEEKHARLAAKLLPDSSNMNGAGTDRTRRGGGPAGAGTRARAAAEAGGSGSGSGARFPGDRGAAVGPPARAPLRH